MDKNTEHCIDTLTLNAELKLEGSTRKVTIEIYDDGHDLVLFAKGDVQTDIQSAIELFSSKEPLTAHLETGSTIEGDESKIFYLTQNPTRDAMRIAVNFTVTELEKQGFSTKVIDGWD
ncbi:hypothetical protein [Pseudomonas laurylsulfatiphila]|uniref:hypothetical protein n=1 Tax=Pseudomonas laurylsulfatiphila TaxID=2011015 RepID=UPI00215E3C79|nr:hypothetical protein [Pseudomonas laurylsulfatiphila]UVM07626.1 hypothetical protein LOY25_13415 [Pseudomonas laurylsulfatiphila]